MTDSYTHQAAQGTASTTDTKTARGDRGRSPRGQNDDCTQHYYPERLSGIDREASPSAGWRRVYRAMGL